MSGTAARYWALELARRGFRVFPLRPGSKLPFEAEKCDPRHRALAGGVHRATSDQKLIESWFDHEPTLNYGISMRGLIGLDADLYRPEAAETLKSLNGLPVTLRFGSARGGTHIIFKGLETSCRDLGPGVNVKSGATAYLVGPGSTYEGKPYTVLEDNPVAELPDYVRTRLSAQPEPRATALVPVVDPDPPGSWDLGVTYACQEESVYEGERNATAYRLAGRLKDFGLSAASTLEILDMYWSPRCDPPFEETGAAVANAYRYGRNAPGCDAISAEFEPVPVEFRDKPALPSISEKGGNFRPLDVMRGPGAVPVRPWLVPGLLMRGALTGLVAPPEAGKSTFVVALSIGLALGRLDWLGLSVKDAAPLRVVLINNEDDEDELLRRLYAICQHHGLDWSATEGRIIIYTPTDRGGFLAIGRDPMTRQLRITKSFAELNRVMEAYGADVFSMDPMAEMHEASENDNGELASKVMKPIRSLAWTRNAAGLLVHHTRKPPSASSESFAGDLNSARGAGAFGAALRASFTLYGMSDKDAEHYGIKQSEKWQYSRLDTSKGSYLSKNRKPLWYRTLSYTLENGDTAPAIEPADLSCFEERQRESYGRVLVPQLEAAGDMKLDAALDHLADEELISKQGRKEIKKTLARLFGEPAAACGWTLSIDGDWLRGWKA